MHAVQQVVPFIRVTELSGGISDQVSARAGCCRSLWCHGLGHCLWGAVLASTSTPWQEKCLINLVVSCLQLFSLFPLSPPKALIFVRPSCSAEPHSSVERSTWESKSPPLTVLCTPKAVYVHTSQIPGVPLEDRVASAVSVCWGLSRSLLLCPGQIRYSGKLCMCWDVTGNMQTVAGLHPLSAGRQEDSEGHQQHHWHESYKERGSGG